MEQTEIKGQSVEEFALWWLEKPRPLGPPALNAIMFLDRSAGIVLYRKGLYQVQLFIVAPNFEFVEHTHPTIDSIEVYLTGNMHFFLEGRRTVEVDAVEVTGLGVEALHPNLGNYCVVPKGVKHSGYAGTEGGAFLSFQKWQSTPTSVDLDWDGPPVDSVHAQRIA